MPKFAQGWGGGRHRLPRSSLLQTHSSLGAASSNREKACPPGEPPTCAVTFQDATELLQELLKLRVLCPQVLAALDGREDRSAHQCVGHQGAEKTEARGELLQGLPVAPLCLGKPRSLHPPRSGQERKCWRGRSPEAGRRCGGRGGWRKAP